MPTIVKTEFQINQTTTSNQANPVITALSDGNFIATWASMDGSSWGVYGRLFAADGTPLSSDYQINQYTVGDQGHTGLSVAGYLSGGRFVVAWHSDGQDGSAYGIYARIFANDFTPIGSEFQVNQYSINNQGSPSVSNLSNGGFVVTWHSEDQVSPSSVLDIYGRVFSNDGIAQGDEFLINTETNGYQTNPTVAGLSNGKFVVTWMSAGTGTYDIKKRTYNNDGTSVDTAESLVNTHTPADQEYSSITKLSSGGYAIAWTTSDQDGSGWGIYARAYSSSDSPLGNEFQVNTTPTDDQVSPVLTGLDNDQFVVVWSSYGQDTSGWGIYGQVCSSNAVLVGSEFKVNTAVVNDQLHPTVTHLSYGNLVVAWYTADSTGVGSGIYGQIYSNQITPITTPSTNKAPIILTGIDDKLDAEVKVPFSFNVRDDAFSDPDGDALTLSATTIDNVTLPKLCDDKNLACFDSPKFTYTPPTPGTSRFSIFATDPYNNQKRADFTVATKTTDTLTQTNTVAAIVSSIVAIAGGAIATVITVWQCRKSAAEERAKKLNTATPASNNNSNTATSASNNNSNTKISNGK